MDDQYTICGRFSGNFLLLTSLQHCAHSGDVVFVRPRMKWFAGVVDLSEATKKKIGLRLREIREAAGMTTAQLAAQVNCHSKAIEEFEDGAGKLSAIQLWEFCAVFDVKPSDFFEDSK